MKALLALTLVAVINNHENSLALIDVQKHAVAAIVPVGNGPHEVAITGDGRTAIVSNYGTKDAPGSSLSIVDLASMKETKRVSVAPLSRPHGLAINGRRVYFTAEGSLAIGRYDLDKGVVDQVIGTAQKISHMIAADRAHPKFYTSNIASNSISAIEANGGPGGWSVEQIPVANGPEAIDVSPDGAHVWTAHRPKGGISIIDTATKKVIGNAPVGTFVFRIRFTPDGKHVLATEPDGHQLLIFDAATHELVKAVPIEGAPVTVAIDKDGTRAYVASAEVNKIFVIDLASFAIVDEMPSGGAPDQIAVAG
ncbi:MAG TPA: YncE family protein [Thermoanaerobaculia bacterium]|nr:YncE family protein [Thermoanaerobaculia bacterium]